MPYPKLVATGPDGISIEVSVDKDVFRIGRSRRNDLVLDDPYQARFHVEIHRRGGSYYLVDLGCRCTKYVNGVPIGAEEETEIKDGDIITIADHELKFLHVDA